MNQTNPTQERIPLERILVVEQDEGKRNEIAGVLRALGVEVAEADDQMSALGYINKNYLQAVIIGKEIESVSQYIENSAERKYLFSVEVTDNYMGPADRKVEDYEALMKIIKPKPKPQPEPRQRKNSLVQVIRQTLLSKAPQEETPVVEEPPTIYDTMLYEFYSNDRQVKERHKRLKSVQPGMPPTPQELLDIAQRYSK